MQAELQINAAVAGAVFGGLVTNGYDLRVRLTAYHGPTLIVQGDHDVVGENTAKDIGDTIFGSKVLYIPHCGHFEWVEQPTILFPALKAFLAAFAAPANWPEPDYPVEPRFFGGRHSHG
jgi:pimeloyl-ACP methyl ester carboxylesterase